MITITPLGDTAVQFNNDAHKIVVFGDKSKKYDDVLLTLYNTPDEDVAEGTISWPGEYDYHGIAILGIGHNEGEEVSYALEFNTVRYGFLNAPLHNWTDYEFEQLGDIDVLCIPALDVKLVQKIVDEVDPRVLIPLHRGDDAKFAEVLKAIGGQNVEPEKEFKLKGNLPAEGRQVVVFG